MGTLPDDFGKINVVQSKYEAVLVVSRYVIRFLRFTGCYHCFPHGIHALF